MNYCPQRKLAFAMPAKTGSTTFEILLTKWGTEVLGNPRHLFPEEAIALKPEFVDYKFYGFFRDPLDRFLSLSRFLYASNIPPTVESLKYPPSIYDDQVDTFDVSLKSKRNVSSPQIKWLQNAEPLNYHNYDMEILKVARMFGQTKVTMIKANETLPCNIVPSQKVIDFVQSYYADDYRFGRERGFLK